MAKIIKYIWNLNDERRYLYNENMIHFEDYKKNDLIQMDFSNVSFITPFCLLGILATSRRVYDTTSEKVELINLADQVFLNMQRMKFFENTKEFVEIDKSYFQLEPWGENQDSINLIEITRIDENFEKGSDDVLKVVNILRDKGSDILAVWLGKDVLEVDQFITVLSEIAQNIFEHSKDFGYVALNKYVYSDKIRLNLSIIDGGVGLVSTIKPKLVARNVTIVNPSNYLAYAFNPGLPRSGGGGLRRVYEIVSGWSGSIFVRSEKACVFKDVNKISFETWDNNPEFRGTHVGIWLEGKNG